MFQIFIFQSENNATVWKLRISRKCTRFSAKMYVGSWLTYGSFICYAALHVTHGSRAKPGAIIGDGDRKFWDPHTPMIWDNFSIFRTNCAILTSYIRAGSTHMSGALAWMLSRFLIRMVKVARFSCRYFTTMAEIRQGIRSRVLHVVLSPELMEIKVSFSGSKTISRHEWTLSARTSWTRKLLLQ